MKLAERIEVIRGDITLLEVDAIVNAANNTLRGGGGVDGAIHKAAGPGLLAECEKLNGCETGKAKITGGYNLKAKYVIHTVGPVWHGGNMDEHALLASCYRESLSLARDNSIRTIAFPGISTGVYGFPKDQAAFIAIKETNRFIHKNKLPQKVIFVAFDDQNYKIYLKYLDNE
ncbi:MAG TPA: O-acetyl-ADP-ribose deacetylase [Bacteroidales bacterium]|nr:O-acetyl-ADP-ribose deacetylase [Bacteroidales bacterium]